MVVYLNINIKIFLASCSISKLLGFCGWQFSYVNKNSTVHSIMRQIKVWPLYISEEFYERVFFS